MSFRTSLLLALLWATTVLANSSDQQPNASANLTDTIASLKQLNATFTNEQDRGYVDCVCDGLTEATTQLPSEILMRCGDLYPINSPGLNKQVGQLVGKFDSRAAMRVREVNLSRRWLNDKKYFSKSDEYSAFPLGLIEAGLNESSRFRTDDRKRADESVYYGISPEELNLRLEPIVSLDGAHNKGLLLSVGWVQNLFPKKFELSADGASVKPVRADGQSAIAYKTAMFLERLAILGGIGYLGDDADTLVYGPGIQVKNLSLWYLFSEKQSSSDWVLGVDLYEIVEKMGKYFR